jgi:hypothetical protein
LLKDRLFQTIFLKCWLCSTCSSIGP